MPEGRGHRASKPQSLNKKETISYAYLFFPMNEAKLSISKIYENMSSSLGHN
jgi:hypothetical protein